MRFGIG